MVTSIYNHLAFSLQIDNTWLHYISELLYCSFAIISSVKGHQIHFIRQARFLAQEDLITISSIKFFPLQYNLLYVIDFE